MPGKFPLPPVIDLPHDAPQSYTGSRYTYDGKHVDLDKIEEQIIQENAPILAEFKGWLVAQGYSKKTVRKHCSNAELFASFLYFREPYRRLVQANDANLYMFFSHFVKDHVAGAKEEILALPASLKKLFTWMGEAGYLSQSDTTHLAEEIWEGRKEYLEEIRETGN
ncbi:MAG TPA: hypothetical protein VMT46_07105 [Anaerolineaceae bacterium]|nr:hypothetical protein [Anaerolineaceae bacterium]